MKKKKPELTERKARSTVEAEVICDGCKVKEPFEHRCFNYGCNCKPCRLNREYEIVQRGIRFELLKRTGLPSQFISKGIYFTYDDAMNHRI